MDILPNAVKLTLSTGIEVHCYPLTVWDNNALSKKAAELFPPPNPKDYERPVPADIAAVPGQMYSADNNPAYKDEVNRVRGLQNTYVLNGWLDLCLEFPAGRDVLIEAFAKIIERKRRRLDLPEDVWEATLRHAVIATEKDLNQIKAAVLQQMPIEEDEIADGVRLFRPLTGRSAVRGLLNGKAKTQSTGEPAQVFASEG